MSVTNADLIRLAPELADVDAAVLEFARMAVPQLVNLDPVSSPFVGPPSKVDLLTIYLSLHVLALSGYGKAAQGRVVSKGAAGVHVTYASVAQFKLSDLESTTWGALYRLTVRSYGYRGAVT